MTDTLTLLARTPDIDTRDVMFAHPDCQSLFENYKEHEAKAGYNPPWIGYLMIDDGRAVGCSGFTGQPVNGRVEIAYWTFDGFEGQGIASFACEQLVAIAKNTDPAIAITAKTLAVYNASVKILQRNGFELAGIVTDEDEGDVWEWVHTGGVIPTSF